MSEFSTTPTGETGSFVLDSNMYWNGGKPIPAGDDQFVVPAKDRHAVLGDPELGEQDGLVVPTWQSTTALFADGSNSTCDVFAELVVRYGTPGPGSAAVDRGRADMAPDHDILGKPRKGRPDLGAVERD